MKALILLLIFAILLNGCYSAWQVKEQENQVICKALKKDSSTVYFGENGARIIDGYLIGKTTDSVNVEIPVTEIEKLYAEKFDLGKTIMYPVFFTLAVFLGAALIFVIFTDGRIDLAG